MSGDRCKKRSMAIRVAAELVYVVRSYYFRFSPLLFWWWVHFLCFLIRGYWFQHSFWHEIQWYKQLFQEESQIVALSTSRISACGAPKYQNLQFSSNQFLKHTSTPRTFDLKWFSQKVLCSKAKIWKKKFRPSKKKSRFGL